MVMKLGLPGGMKDSALLQLLLEKGNLTDMQMADTVVAAARVATGGHLAKHERDRLMSIAMAQKLTERTQIKKRNDAPTANPGDAYSTRTTPGTISARSLIDKYTTRDKRGALLISPPGRPRRVSSVPPPPVAADDAQERKTGS